MQAWFRVYREAVHDPKLLLLSDADHRMWFSLLCLAEPSSGAIPSIEAIALTLRMDVSGVEAVVERLVSGGLIDRACGGPRGWHYVLHGWLKRQYKSDTSTDRVKRFRDAKRNVSETPSDTDTDTEKEETSLRSVSTSSDEPASQIPRRKRAVHRSEDVELGKAFDAFWPLYPRRQGVTDARAMWMREIRLEFVPDVIQAVLRYAEMRRGEPEQYTKLAATWLNKGRWRDSLTDEKPTTAAVAPPPGRAAPPGSTQAELQRNAERRRLIDAEIQRIKSEQQPQRPGIEATSRA